MREAAALAVWLDGLVHTPGSAERAYWRHFWRCMVAARTVGDFEALLLGERYAPS